MKISTLNIINRIDYEFTNVYKPFSNFPHSGKVWNECIATVRDSKLMNNIIFSNDVLLAPPVKVFLMANGKLDDELSDYEKKAIGAFWGFIFKFVFGYRNQRSISIRVNDVKSATYFFDNPQPIEIENE